MSGTARAGHLRPISGLPQARTSFFAATFFSTSVSTFLESFDSSRVRTLIWLWVATPAAWMRRFWNDSACLRTSFPSARVRLAVVTWSSCPFATHSLIAFSAWPWMTAKRFCASVSCSFTNAGTSLFFDMTPRSLEIFDGLADSPVALPHNAARQCVKWPLGRPVGGQPEGLGSEGSADVQGRVPAPIAAGVEAQG